MTIEEPVRPEEEGVVTCAEPECAGEDQIDTCEEGSRTAIQDVLVSSPPAQRLITRRNLFKAAVCSFAGVAVYGVGIDRHWLETSHYDVYLPGLPEEFDGFRVVQLSDIHIDEFTEPFFVEDAVHRINRLNPDAVFLTGDFVTHQIAPKKFAEGSAWQCANILNKLKSRQRYAIFGNHDVMVGEDLVGTALRDNGIAVLRNSYLPLERGKGRVWLAGLDDPVEGKPDPDLAIPAAIRGLRNEPVLLLCHAPDYADQLLRHPAGESVVMMLSGHTHGGQVRVPFMPLMHLPPMGHKYVEGWYNLGAMQLHVNRGLGTVGVPVRFNCPPQLSVHTLRSGPRSASAA